MCISTRVDRIVQQAQHAVVARGLPLGALCAAGARHSRHLDTLLAQPEIHAPGAAEFGEFAKHQVDGRAHALVGILLEAIVDGAYVADGHMHVKLSAFSLLLHRFVRSLPEAGQFHLADRAFHAEQQPVIHLHGIIDAFCIDEQRPHNAAELQQRVPVSPVACQARRFDAQNRADLAIAKQAQQSFEARAQRA